MVITERDALYIAEFADVPIVQVLAVADLLNDGMTIPFIARYRKEKTGNLDEVKVLLIKEGCDFVHELSERKATILKTIEEQGLLTDELRSAIEKTYSKNELEDLYLPFKPKRRTKATIAREKGLEPLALLILDPISPERDVLTLAGPFCNPEAGVASPEEALEGAENIILEIFSERADVRKLLRTRMAEDGEIVVTVTEDWKDQRSKFEQYYEYRERVKSIPSHRFLAVRRGEEEKVLRSKIEIDRELMVMLIKPLIFQENHPRAEYLSQCLLRAVTRRILPSLELEILMEVKQRADEEAIAVFATNLENVLLAPPVGSIRVLGVDPGFRTGCKLVVLDGTGKLLDLATIYPTKPREDFDGSAKVVLHFIKKYNVEAVAIGNGTASRESRAFFTSIVPRNVIVSVINEAGASIYSASDLAREEFPDHDLTIRGAVSIGRRFQDPLAELVKIDPKSIGVGQYQHDVHQGLLKKKLDTVVSLVVNRVGVDLNTASQQILRYISGIGESLAKNIVSYRDEHGMFTKRDDIMKVRLFGGKAFQQSAGFLRIRGGDNPLDTTGIHPEAYSVVTAIAERSMVPLESLIGNRSLLTSVSPKDFITETFGLPTIKDIISELENPGRDPRADFEQVEFNEEVHELVDLQDGMILNGIVTNVTKFGAFVDIGVHQDGLVHISQLSNQYVTNPETVVAVGQKVKVKVLSVDTTLKRIQLSMKEASQKSDNRPPDSKKHNETRSGKPKPQQQPQQQKPSDMLNDLKARFRRM